MNFQKHRYCWVFAILAGICCTILLCSVSGTVHAAQPQVEYIEPIFVVRGNPSLDYAPQPIRDDNEPEYADTLEEAAEHLRRQLKDWDAQAVVYLQLPRFDEGNAEKLNEQLGKVIDDVFDLAVVHTGNAKEGDYLSHQYDGWTAGVRYSGAFDKSYLTIEYNMAYYTTKNQEKDLDKAVKDLLKALDLDDATDYQKVKGVYDWLCQNVTYDEENLNDPNYLRKHSAYAAIVDRTAVCQGYATAMYRLLLELNVDVRYVGGIGNGGPHGWNIVKLGQKYYNLDATWDAQRVQSPYNLSYAYFLKSDAEFLYHMRDNVYYSFVNTNNYPMTQTSFHNERFTVTFQDEDGRVLSRNVYQVGQPIIPPKNPEKATANGVRYTFKGWDQTVGVCEGEQTFTAVYTKEYIDYTVVFKDWNGVELSKKTYHYGDAIVAPNAPVRAADNTYTYTFKGWDKELTCTGNMTIKAEYAAVYIDYTVVFVNWDGTELSKKTYHYADAITAPKTPVKVADNTYTYTFKGWDKELICIGDMTIKAKYAAEYIDYLVVFRYEDGTVISQNTYHYGQDVEAPEQVSPPVGQEDYVYTGWDSPVTKCFGNKEYIAVFTSPVKSGDCNGDGYINNEDVIYLLWHTLFEEDYPLAYSGDVNGDGYINNEDVIYLLWHTLFEDDYPLAG